MKSSHNVLENIRNTEILSLLRGGSCHGDIVEPVDNILRLLPDVKWFCPNPNDFEYCFWYSNNIVFTFGTGMQNIGIRLPVKQSKNDKRSGGFIGRYKKDEWWSVGYNLSSLEKWAIMAYEYAKST